MAYHWTPGLIIVDYGTTAVQLHPAWTEVIISWISLRLTCNNPLVCMPMILDLKAVSAEILPPPNISRKKCGLARYQLNFMLFELGKNSAKIQLSKDFCVGCWYFGDACRYFT